MTQQPDLTNAVDEEKKDEGEMEVIEVELAAGARAFAFKNYAIATECFSRACEKLNTHHSKNYNAVIDAHISYGKALLRNAISLGGLLGGLNDNNLPAESDDATTPAVSSSSKAVASTSKPADQPNAKNPHIHFSGDSSDEGEGEEGDEADDQAIEEPVTVEEELENAFQVLEFARQSIQSQIDSLSATDSSSQNEKELEKFYNKLVDVYDLIAQVHQEGEQFELAVESYKSCLDIKKTRGNFPPGTIAETHLMIALALELIPDGGESMKQAIGHVEEAIQLMKGHLNNLEKKSTTHPTDDPKKEESKDVASASPDLKTSQVEEKSTHQGNENAANGGSNLKLEIEEVQSLIKELEAKRDELSEVPQPPPMTEGDKALQAYLAAVNQNPATSTSTSSTTTNTKTVVNDLDSLVKKRPRPVENNQTKEVSSHPDPTNIPPETPSKRKKI